MNIENIIFDVDGTLWDSTGEVAKAWNLAVKELGIECEEITSDTLKREFGKPMNVIADHLFPSASAAEKERALEKSNQEYIKLLEEEKYPSRNRKESSSKLRLCGRYGGGL